MPQFFVTAQEFWTVPYPQELPLESQSVGVVDEGFLLKPEIVDPEADRTGLNEIIEYTVQSGDTLSKIAQTFGITTRTLIENNSLPNPNALRKGDVVKIIPVNGLIHKIKKGDSVKVVGVEGLKVEVEKVG